ncbi:hypothetical protein [Streptomyces katrae]|uniref:hypothetical protein n=1 Tax=Streptomyces katrae TaxID=68223 RepID=UPI0006969CF0|nr:hypothetical protein [Streptomyces katrae]
MAIARQHHTGNRRLLAAAAAAATVAALTAGCTSGSKNDKNAATGPSVSPSATTAAASPTAPADPEAADKAEVQAAYTHYWDVLTAAYAKSDPDDPNLTKVATGNALVQNQQDLANFRKGGRVFVGRPQHSNSAISFKADTKLKTAVITDCLDISQWKVVEKNGGKEVELPSTRLLRYVNTVTAEKWPNGWMVLEDKQEGKAC